MNIQQLSRNIDVQLAQLDQKLDQLAQQLALGADDSNRLESDKAALERIKAKLQKSQTLMWQTHQLGRSTDQQRLRAKRRLGLGLCLASALGLAALTLLFFRS